MAVVSLSRIQVRRGKTNGQPLPQLASGELAWAIDTRELYIGNGTTAEGAPDVGNTRILTEHDNAFELSRYSYKELTVSVERTAQDRLDDYVSIRAFDGINDSTRLQNAINSLFGEDSFSTNAVILYIEPGTYTLTDTITIPPYARIQGSGVGRTIFNIVNNDNLPVFDMPTIVNNTVGVVTPSGIYFDGFTVDLANVATGQKSVFSSKALSFSKFSNIEILGNPANRDTTVGIEILNYNIGPTEYFAKHNVFENVSVKNAIYSVYTTSDIMHNTWKNCFFENNLISIYFHNEQYTQELGCVQNVIENCWFDLIDQHAIKIVRGSANLSHANKFNNVGNSPSGTPLFSVIDFGLSFGKVGNASEEDWFERVNQIISGVPYIPEVSGNANVDHRFKFHKIFRKDLGIDFVKFHLYVSKMQTIEVSYQYKGFGADDILKSGTLTILSNSENGDISFDDNYRLLGTSDVDTIEFSILGYNLSGSTENLIDTLEVTVLDSTNTNDADFYYSVKYLN